MLQNPKKKFILYFSLLFQKKAIIYVLPFNEISIQPEISSPPNFRIQGGVTWARHSAVVEVKRY